MRGWTLTPKTSERRSSRPSRGGCPRQKQLASSAWGSPQSSATSPRPGRSLAPKKRPSSKLKMDATGRRLLEADLEERPAATLPQRREYLGRVAGVRVNNSTASRMLKRLGWNRKKTGGSDGTR